MVPSISRKASRSAAVAARISIEMKHRRRCGKNEFMGSIDMPLDQMRKYLAPLYREADFESYWKSTVAEALHQPLNAELIPYDLPARGVQSYAVRFDGFGGGRIAGWYLRPDSRAKMPGVCVYHGYSGRAQRPYDLLALAS